jgi:hypothetical protein
MALYQQLRRRRTHSNWYQPSVSQYRFFDRTANAINTVQADPIEYMEAQFFFFPVEGQAPYPSQLATDSAIERWRSYIEYQPHDFAAIVVAQLRTISSYYTMYKAERTLEDVILDWDTPLHAYLRVLLVGKEKARTFFPEAQQEVLSSIRLYTYLEEVGVDVKTIFEV